MSKPAFKQLVSQLDLRLRHRVPMVHQTESSECGLACLAMICGYYGKNIDLIALRRQFNLSTRGATLVGLTGIADQLGLSTRPLSLDLDELNALKLPCILHWEFNHFVVLVSVKGHRAVLHDPARGRRAISLTELSHSFTGVALEAWPGSAFTADSVRHR
ncbi:TPA: cysteine peptidase family C39 domain-containing protein, partial [Serratia marcescens]